MRTSFLITGLAGLVLAAPRPQNIDFKVVESASNSTEKGPDAAAISDPIDHIVTRGMVLSKLALNDSCVPQPHGHGPKPIVDTPEEFLALQDFSDIAEGATTPSGYDVSFKNLKASVNANNYMGFYTLGSYDPSQCQKLCDTHNLCTGFNIFFERDPALNPAPRCPNPPSVTNIKCSLWGSGVTENAAVNVGSTRAEFAVRVAGSNGYSRRDPHGPIAGFEDPVPFPGAINAPLNSVGKGTYLSVKYWPGVYDAGKCAAACRSTTAYNMLHAHDEGDGTYQPCNFFNAYLLSKNNVPQGTYCTLYTQPWGKEYATNVGEHRGDDDYTVSESYGFTLSPQDQGFHL